MTVVSLSAGIARRRFTIWGYLAFLIWAVVMAVLASGVGSLLVLGLVVVFSAFFCAGSLRVVRSPQFWFLLASALLLSPLFIGAKDMTLWGVPLSREGFWVGVWMAVRALNITLAFNGVASSVSVVELSRLLERGGLKGMGFALGIALNTLPAVQDVAATSLAAMRLRGGFRRDRLGSLKKLLVTIVASSLRRGEDIVDAAEARAFDPARVQGSLARPAWSDLLLVSALLVCSLLLLV